MGLSLEKNWSVIKIREAFIRIREPKKMGQGHGALLFIMMASTDGNKGK